MRHLLICLAFQFATPLAASAQPTGSLLPPTSTPGDRITVTTAAGAHVSGRLVRDGAGTLVLAVSDDGGRRTG